MFEIFYNEEDKKIKTHEIISLCVCIHFNFELIVLPPYVPDYFDFSFDIVYNQLQI